MRAALLDPLIGVLLLGAAPTPSIYHGNDTGGIIPVVVRERGRWRTRLPPPIARAGTNITASPACIGNTATSSRSIACGRRTSTAYALPAVQTRYELLRSARAPRVRALD